MPELEVDYFGSFDPYEPEEFKPIVVVVGDAIYGIIYGKGEFVKQSDLADFINQMIPHVKESGALYIKVGSGDMADKLKRGSL
jgi:hypothetical protein